jgi:hypothetical protein
MPIGMLFIARWFGGGAPHAINEYYGRGFPIPGGGQIAFSDFDAYFRRRGITPREASTGVIFSVTVDV